MSNKPTIGITLGDQAGVGPEVVHAALQHQNWSNQAKLQIIGDSVPATLGKPDIHTAKAALKDLELGAQMMKSGEIDAIVTSPVAKEQLHQVGFEYPGQTEFFADRLDCENFAMCLTGPSLTVALVTIHVAITEVPTLLKTSEIIRIGNLLKDFCEIKHQRPARIAVCGLNPHAGESGAFGDEEITTIGPFPPDTIFRPTVDGEFDAVLCMYHDQGLIPLKLLDFDIGVNTTLGLPKPRTSPDHGTAFDIAGKGTASPNSMIEAIKLAIEIA